MRGMVYEVIDEGCGFNGVNYEWCGFNGVIYEVCVR